MLVHDANCFCLSGIVSRDPRALDGRYSRAMRPVLPPRRAHTTTPGELIQRGDGRSYVISPYGARLRFRRSASSRRAPGRGAGPVHGTETVHGALAPRPLPLGDPCTPRAPHTETSWLPHEWVC